MEVMGDIICTWSDFLNFAKLSEHSYNTCVKAESPYLIAQFKF